ncbi:SDR family NAD(P)-dependent oxidoreductase [Paenibacillus sp. PSB04]|uniref:SDR family NAD(P)-dependent oxidoreductase n=1 Tax=Paenibacillus sp. PSB04 TaxID=2866810 RepID=UPI0021F1F462|nr:SDR family NAD(P)-dependent oxidoreductase [Paenibacillus sp. PSB04]UYO07219.1 SDR family NAD(P)-dependent oxidoreductase [Paenibacillus sp. PSB04]
MKTNSLALITGANNGIGLELTRRLLDEGWTVLALVRSAFPSDDALIQKALANRQLRQYKADLANFSALQRALDEIKSKEDKIDVLFNNAGGSFPELAYSKQGREMHFELQTVVPYIIFMELKDLLKQGSFKTIINTSSSTMKMVRRFEPAELASPRTFKKLFGPYASTKLALSLWTREIAPLAAAEGLTIRSADPGGNNTMRKGKNSGLPWYIKIAMKLVMSPPSKGASLLYEAAFGKHKMLNGVYLSNNEPTELKYAEAGRPVLELVQGIYKNEYAARAQ